MHVTFFAVDCLAIFAELLLAIGLVRSQPRSTTAWLTALMLVNTAGFVLFARAMYAGWIPPPYQVPVTDPVIVLLQVMMNTTPGVFMLLCFNLFLEPSTRFPRFPRVLGGLFALQLALEDLLPFLLGITTHPSRDVTMTDTSTPLYLVFETLPTALQAVFIAAGLYWTAKEWRVDLVETRRLLRIGVVLLTGVHLISYTVLTRLVLAPDDIRAFYLHEAYIALAALVAGGIIAMLIEPERLERVALVQAGVEPADSDRTADLDYARFQTAIDEHVYREAGLTIASLALQLKIPEYRLRRLINTRLGYRNFNQMLHAYRIAEASTALADPEQRRLPILTVALTVGYQSINPFNRAFRELKGTTPSAFRQQALAGTHDAASVPEQNGNGAAT